MLTSEQQKIYNVKAPKGGYGYYTLYHGIYDPENDIDERPSYAQTGDLFEPEGSSVVYKATRRNGKTTWAIAEDAQRQSESGEGGSGGGGGGAEKFIVTLTQDAQTETWTADKTIADIVAADEANQVVVAKYPRDGLIVDIPLSMAMEFQGMFAAVFVGLVSSGNDNKVVAVQCMDEGSGAAITIVEQNIPTSTNAPLIVTLTESEGTLTGDKTYQEIKEARLAGRPVDLVVDGYTCSSVLDVSGESSISVSFIANGQLATATGAPSDYVSKTLG